MNKLFERVIKHLNKQFSKDRNMALATSFENLTTLRIVDTYYLEGSLYIVTHDNSEKVKQILKNKNVSLCVNLNEFQGEAYHIGRPLDKRNKELREILINAFSNWYFAHNDESDPKMCYIQVRLDSCITYIGKKGYIVDFNSRIAELLDI